MLSNTWQWPRVTEHAQFSSTHSSTRYYRYSIPNYLVSYRSGNFWYRPSLELERTFYYVPCPLIDRAPRNDATSLTMYTTHTHASDYNICILYTLNPVKRDGPTGHKNSSVAGCRAIAYKNNIIVLCKICAIASSFLKQTHTHIVSNVVLGNNSVYYCINCIA